MAQNLLGGVFLLANVAINNTYAWNIVWENNTTTGKCRSPVSCRNLNNDGIVTASFWHHTTLSTFNDRFQVKIIETDDNGSEVYKNSNAFYYSSGFSVAVERIELQKILPNPSEDNYLILGFARDPNNTNTPVQSFYYDS
jgi:hypothetical protein